jgi:hypothetical protein
MVINNKNDDLNILVENQKLTLEQVVGEMPDLPMTLPYYDDFSDKRRLIKHFDSCQAASFSLDGKKHNLDLAILDSNEKYLIKLFIIVIQLISLQRIIA